VDLNNITLIEIRITQNLKNKSILLKINSPLTSNLRLFSNLNLKIALVSLKVKKKERFTARTAHKKTKAIMGGLKKISIIFFGKFMEFGLNSRTKEYEKRYNYIIPQPSVDTSIFFIDIMLVNM